MSQTRRFAAILATDVVGYSRLIGADEKGTLERLKALHRALLDPKIVEHHGRFVKTTGDGMLVELRASSMRAAARSRCSTRCPSETMASRRTTASNCASASISAM
jgi:class 3 adenylate cyclase